MLDFLTNPKIVKRSAYIGVCSISFALLIGVIIAQLDPQGYNVVDNYISDMGSLRHTPFPYLWDLGQMICACAMVPAVFYIRKTLLKYPKVDDTLPSKSRERARTVLCDLALISMLIVLTSMFLVGLFSEDRTTQFHLHGFFSYFVWSAFGSTSLFIGLLIAFYPSPAPRELGKYMIILPPISALIFLTTFNKFSEWLLLFSLMAWMIPFALIMLKYINKEIKSI